MLETIREYALERLAERGEADATPAAARRLLPGAGRGRPSPGCASCGPSANRGWSGWRLSMITCAPRWNGSANMRKPNSACGSRWALRVFWQQRFHWGEGRAWLEAALAKSGSIAGAARAKALVAAGHLACSRGDSMARVYIEEGLALLRGLGDKATIATALWLLGNIVLNNGEYAMARACAEESLAVISRDERPVGPPVCTSSSRAYRDSAGRSHSGSSL